MSRIGKKIIIVPEGVEVKIEKENINIKGKKGELNQFLPNFIKIENNENQIKVFVNSPEDKKQNACWGTFAALISNMVKGVNEGFEKKLELVGVGFRAQVNGNKIILNIGFSHQVEFLLPQGIEAVVEQNTILLKGIDKQLVGEMAAQIRKLRKPEPYKGKGIRYFGEIVRKKAGKKAGA